MPQAIYSRKLHLGCGGTILRDFINLDQREGPGVDCIFNLERCDKRRLPFEANTFTHMLMVHCFEHITNVLPMMQELWRVAAPGCLFDLHTPYGSSDNADEDPTHVRRVFKNTFQYFSQCYYGKNDYGYRGDWEFLKRTYRLKRKMVYGLLTKEEMQETIDTHRNVVDEFRVTLEAIKPKRPAGFLAFPTATEYELVDG